MASEKKQNNLDEKTGKLKYLYEVDRKKSLKKINSLNMGEQII